MLQNLRTGSVDLITPGEMTQMLHDHLGNQWSTFFRQRYAGLKLMKLPVLRVTATAAAFILASTPGNVSESGPPFAAIPGGGGLNCGPESGYIWLLSRVLISSNVAADSAVYQLYTGSDFTLQQASMLDGGGSTQLPVNKAYYPGNRGAWVFPEEEVYASVSSATIGNTYLLSGVVVEAPAEMVGKLID
jgi:hypothetical protein